MMTRTSDCSSAAYYVRLSQEVGFLTEFVEIIFTSFAPRSHQLPPVVIEVHGLLAVARRCEESESGLGRI